MILRLSAINLKKPFIREIYSLLVLQNYFGFEYEAFIIAVGLLRGNRSLAGERKGSESIIF
jgi:hypothetical protein